MNYGYITYSRQGEPAQTVPLRPGSMTLGRARDNDIVLDAADVAPHHVRLICAADFCMVIDLVNGTWLNQVRLEPRVRHPLNAGDELQIGSFRLFYHRTAPADTAATPETKLEPSGMTPPEIAGLLPVAAAAFPGSPIGSMRRWNNSRGARPALPEGFHLPAGASSYMQYLPVCYHQDELMGRFLLIFESILDPLKRTIDQLHAYVDPWLIPESALPWLASWVDLVLNANWPVERRRALISAAADLYRWRGTRRGLRSYLRIYAGVEPDIVEAWQQPVSGGAAPPAHVFTVILAVPNPDQVDRALVEQIIEAEKPAHTSYTLEICRKEPAPGTGPDGATPAEIQV